MQPRRVISRALHVHSSAFKSTQEHSSAFKYIACTFKGIQEHARACKIDEGEGSSFEEEQGENYPLRSEMI